jgi:hypothetical protein
MKSVHKFKCICLKAKKTKVGSVEAEKFLAKYNNAIKAVNEYAETVDELINDINAAGYLKEPWTDEEAQMVLNCINLPPSNRSCHSWSAINYATNVLSTYKQHMKIDDHLKFYELLGVNPLRITDEQKKIEILEPATGYTWIYYPKESEMLVDGNGFYISVKNTTNITETFNRLKTMINLYNQTLVAG